MSATMNGCEIVLSKPIGGFQVQPHLYLSRSLDAHTDDAPGSNRKTSRALAFDTWRETDVEPVARLLQRAYDPADAALFAPNGEPAEWVRYVKNLVSHTACGALNRDVTQLLREGDEIRAVALMTDISPGTAHLVQLAVDPTLRGGKVGRALVDAVCASLVERDIQAMTLIVAAENKSARALYDAAGFRPDAIFLAATLQLSAPAPATSMARDRELQPTP